MIINVKKKKKMKHVNVKMIKKIKPILINIRKTLFKVKLFTY